MKFTANRFVAVASSLLAAVAFAVACAAALSLAAIRTESIRNAESKLVREAGIIGERLDGVFRVASVILIAASVDSGDFTRASLLLPEAANFLELGSSGAVVRSAYPRSSLSPLASPLLERLRAGSRFEVGMADFPFEGGSALALMHRKDDASGKYGGAVAAVFNARLLDSTAADLLDSAVDTIQVRDASDQVLFSRSASSMTPASGAPALLGSYLLHSLPLSVVVLADRDALLAPRYRPRLAAMVLAGLFSLLLGLFSAYAFAMLRGLRRADELARELDLRDALYREVNHRVKNDLQIVRSVLSLGQSCLGDQDKHALDALRAAEDRINSISLVHEQLYKRAALAAADLGAYMRDLAANLKLSYGKDRPIEVSVAAEPGLSLNLDAAVSCGLLLNELVTNAYKYAFPGGRNGTISLSAARLSSGRMELRIGDDGVGFSESDADKRRDSSFGLVLVKALAGQLQAELRREGGPGQGTCWTVTLPPPASEQKKSPEAV